MKNLKYIIFMGLLFLMGQNKVSAYGLSCTYKDTINNRTLYYNLQTINYNDTNGVNELFYYNGNDKVDIGSLSCSDTSDGCLYSLGVMSKEGSLTCPRLYVHNIDGSYSNTYMGGDTSYREIPASDKECDYPNNCNYYEQGGAITDFTCNYVQSSGDKKISISYKSIGDITNWDVLYPDGTSERFTIKDLGSNFRPPVETCEDIYYIGSTKGIIDATNSLTGLCTKYQKGDFELYCAEGRDCHFAAPECPTICNLVDIPESLPIYISNLVNLVKVLVPIILVIMGMIDFMKAAISSDEKQMKESQGRFVRRLFAAIIIFFVVVIVQFAFRVISSDNTISGCIDCFINGGPCSFQKTEDNEEDSESGNGNHTSSSGAEHGGGSHRH